MKRTPLREIAAHLNLLCFCSEQVKGFAIDSRKLREGELFFALPGQRVDGHQFLQEAAQKKAVGAVVSTQYRGEHFGLPLLAVEDVKNSLHQLAKIAARKRKEKRIAITGSLGKTTVKEFISSLLKKYYRVGHTEGNANTQLSVPLFWLNLEGEYDFLVVEMGMSEPLQIQQLVEIAPPDLALITRIASAHIANFPDGFSGIARAKAEVFSHFRTTLGIVSTQAMQFKEIRDAGVCKKYTYGEGGDFSLQVCTDGIMIKEKRDQSPIFLPPFQASHLLENLLAAISIGRLFSMSWEQIQQGCAKLTAAPFRFETEVLSKITFVKDCYNANPVSMCAALSNLPPPGPGGRRIGVLGMMPEQGSFSTVHHREVAEYALEVLDILFCIGIEALPMVEVFLKANRFVEYFEELGMVQKRLLEIAKEGDVVLIKGANFLKLWQLMEQYRV